MRRVARTLAGAAPGARRHSWVPCKGRVEYRLDQPIIPGVAALDKLERAEAANAAPEPRNKKEALAHLADATFSFEGKSDMQRDADDMMAIYQEILPVQNLRHRAYTHVKARGLFTYDDRPETQMVEAFTEKAFDAKEQKDSGKLWEEDRFARMAKGYLGGRGPKELDNKFEHKLRGVPIFTPIIP